jgi:enamine deaminase RidA (YjgF/YER057c/UK114 family)
MDSAAKKRVREFHRSFHGTLANAVRLTIFLTDFAHFAKVNEIMASYFSAPYPARATVGVAQLPRGVHVEIDCVLDLS